MALGIAVMWLGVAGFALYHGQDHRLYLTFAVAWSVAAYLRGGR